MDCDVIVCVVAGWTVTCLKSNHLHINSKKWNIVNTAVFIIVYNYLHIVIDVFLFA